MSIPLIYAMAGCQPATEDTSAQDPDRAVQPSSLSARKAQTTEADRRMEKAGLVDVNAYDPELANPAVVPVEKPGRSPVRVHLDPSEKLSRVYLQPEVAHMLQSANLHLKSQYPELRILPVSGVRPRSLQIKLWTEAKKHGLERYYAAPYPGSNHNYGAAIDVTLADFLSGTEVDMGSPVGEPGPISQGRFHRQSLASGQLKKIHIRRRTILKEAMKSAGFRPILTEWWHFNAYHKEVIRKKFEIVE